MEKEEKQAGLLKKEGSKYLMELFFCETMFWVLLDIVHKYPRYQLIAMIGNLAHQTVYTGRSLPRIKHILLFLKVSKKTL